MNALSLALVPNCMYQDGDYTPVIYFVCDGRITHQWTDFYKGDPVELSIAAREIAQKEIDRIQKFAYPYIINLFTDIITQHRYTVYASYEDIQALKSNE